MDDNVASERVAAHCELIRTDDVIDGEIVWRSNRH